MLYAAFSVLFVAFILTHIKNVGLRFDWPVMWVGWGGLESGAIFTWLCGRVWDWWEWQNNHHNEETILQHWRQALLQAPHPIWLWVVTIWMWMIVLFPASLVFCLIWMLIVYISWFCYCLYHFWTHPNFGHSHLLWSMTISFPCLFFYLGTIKL